MGKYDSPFFNQERYYDPTAGAVLAKLAREEREKYSGSYNKAKRIQRDYMIVTDRPDPVRMFAYRYAKKYEAEHGRKNSGKPKALGNPVRNENYIRAYLYCMDNADSEVDLEPAIKRMYNIEGRRIKQCFTRTGNLGKLINAWIDFIGGNGEKEMVKEET